jgi:hypothetical protein
MEVIDNTEVKFMEFVTQYGRSYGTREEYDFRAAIFKEKLAWVQKQNADKNQTASFAINEFADRTQSEMKKYMGL